MPALDAHQSNEFVKALVLGDSKAGKTGALVSLVEVGYKLFILDYDNLLDSLKYQIQQRCPDKLGNVEFRTLRDKRKHSALGPIIDGQPKAFIRGIQMIDSWKYKYHDQEIDHGVPSEWGPDCILVIDSLSRLCDAAYDFREPLTPKGKDSGQADARATYGDAQDAVENLLAHITSDFFRTNVLVIAHIVYQETSEGIKGYPQGVGQKLSPKIPQYFPSVIRVSNNAGKRIIQTNSTPLIDLANPAPFKMAKQMPIETGMADFFGTLRPHPNAGTATPKLVRKV